MPPFVRTVLRSSQRYLRLRILRGVRLIKYSRWLNERYPGLKDKALWRGCRESFARAGFIGVMCAFTPMPMQMPMAAIGAYYARANIPLAVALAWITNPLTMGPLWLFGYKVGAWVLGTPPVHANPDANWLAEVFPQIWFPLWFGNILLGFLFGGLLYLVLLRVRLPLFRKKRTRLPVAQDVDA